MSETVVLSTRSVKKECETCILHQEILLFVPCFLLCLQELERRLALQEQDSVIVKNMKSEVARLPELERENKRLREENTFLRFQHCHQHTFCVMDTYINLYLE